MKYFFYGVPNSTINFCDEFKQVTGDPTCDNVTIAATQLMSADYPSQGNSLFGTQAMTETDPFIYSMQDDVSTFGNWQISYLKVPSQFTQDINIDYPCRKTHITFSAPLSTQIVADYAMLLNGLTSSLPIDSYAQAEYGDTNHSAFVG